MSQQHHRWRTSSAFFNAGMPPLHAMQSKAEFFAAAVIYGLNIGAVQSYSRALLTELVPDNMLSEFMSLYELSDKGTSFLGPILFSIINEATGKPRWAIFSIVLFEVLGMSILFFVNPKKGIEEAKLFHINAALRAEERARAQVTVRASTALGSSKQHHSARHGKSSKRSRRMS